MTHIPVLWALAGSRTLVSLCATPKKVQKTFSSCVLSSALPTHIAKAPATHRKVKGRVGSGRGKNQVERGHDRAGRQWEKMDMATVVCARSYPPFLVSLRLFSHLGHMLTKLLAQIQGYQLRIGKHPQW